MSTHQSGWGWLVPSFELLEPRLLLSGAGSDLLAPLSSVGASMAGGGEPIQEELDFGDAPDSAEAPSYPTLLVNDGARHVIVEGFYLGAGVDGEGDGQPDIDALGDDTAGFDDEDGVTFWGPLMPGVTAALDVEACALYVHTPGARSYESRPMERVGAYERAASIYRVLEKHWYGPVARKARAGIARCTPRKPPEGIAPDDPGRLAALARPNVLVFMPLLFGWLVLRRRRRA